MARYMAVLGALALLCIHKSFCWLDSLREQFEFMFHGDGHTHYNPQDYGRPNHHHQHHPVAPLNDWPFVKRPNPVSYQSPIDIDTRKVRAVPLPTLEWHLLWDIDEEDVSVINNGHTVEVEMSHNEHKPFMLGGPLNEPYVFEQMHFHWGKNLCGSEHWINGKCYPTEVHLLHYNKKYGSVEEAQRHPDGLAVITFFGKHSHHDNPDLKPLLKALNYIIEPNTRVRKTFGKEFKFLRKHMEGQKYFAAPGSLTTAPYAESVTWIFFLDMFDISRDQLAQLRRLKSDKGHIEITRNTRELQQRNGRPIIKPLNSDPWGDAEDEIVVVED